MEHKVLVACFSASGVTRHIGLEIAEACGGDYFDIVPAAPYTDADLNWMDKKSRSTREMNDPASRPEIASQVAHMEEYDTVFIGFPIWWGVAPRIIDTFLESYDFSGKTLIPFCTSGGSGVGKSDSELHKDVKGEVVWKKGTLIHRASEIRPWLKDVL